MSQLMGADTRRVGLIAEGLHGYSEDVQNLRTMAQRAVFEMRNAWGGGDFEHIARRWEQEAGPRLADAASSLSAMVGVLRSQAAEQRRASGDPGGARVPVGIRNLLGDGAQGGRRPGGGVASMGGQKLLEDLDPADLDVDLASVLAGEPVADKVKDNITLNLAGGGVHADASLVSRNGGNDNLQYELSAGKVEAGADYSVDLDAHGNLVASAGASASAYLGYAAGKAQAGNDFAHVGADGKAYVGAEVAAEGSGSIGSDGVRGHLGAEAFAGAKAEVNVSGTVAGATASAGAEISYGIGAHANADAELSATKVGIALDVGATLGIGGGAKLDVSVNPQEVVANVDHAVDEIGDAAEGIGEDITEARAQVANLLKW